MGGTVYRGIGGLVQERQGRLYSEMVATLC